MSEKCDSYNSEVPSTDSVEKSLEKVKELLKTYDRSSTCWYEDAFNKLKTMNDPIATTIFSWCVIE